jgi:hypothetical protein
MPQTTFLDSFQTWASGLSNAALDIGSGVSDFMNQRQQLQIQKLQAQGQLESIKASQRLEAAMKAQPTPLAGAAHASGLPPSLFGIPTATLMTIGAIVMAYKVLK